MFESCRGDDEPRGPSDPSVIRPGELVEAAGPLTHARVAWENSLIPRTFGPGPERHGRASRPRALGPWPKSPGTAGQPRGPWDSTASRARQLVDPAGFQTRTRGPRNYWSTPRGLGYSPQLPRRDGLPHGPTDTGPCRPRRLFDNAVRLTRVGVARDNWLTTGTRTLTGVTWDSWSTPRPLGMECEFPGTPG